MRWTSKTSGLLSAAWLVDTHAVVDTGGDQSPPIMRTNRVRGE